MCVCVCVWTPLCTLRLFIPIVIYVGWLHRSNSMTQRCCHGPPDVRDESSQSNFPTEFSIISFFERFLLKFGSMNRSEQGRPSVVKRWLNSGGEGRSSNHGGKQGKGFPPFLFSYFLVFAFFVKLGGACFYRHLYLFSSSILCKNVSFFQCGCLLLYTFSSFLLLFVLL